MSIAPVSRHRLRLSREIPTGDDRDVRHGSLERVAAAVGEGSGAVRAARDRLARV